MAVFSQLGLGLKANGELWTWGNNYEGVLGHNTTTEKSSPVLVVGNHSFVSVFCNPSPMTMLALKANGELWAWGYNASGTLGDNTTTHKSSPILVIGNHSFIKISVGGRSSFALKANGELWSWGENNFGQLGHNDITYKSSPVLVVGNHSFIDVATYENVSFALKSNGEVWSWGRNTDNEIGHLGDNTNTNRSSPVLVVGNHSFIQISVGCALKANGEVWTWGPRAIGDNDLIGRSSPVLVVGNHSFIKIINSYEYRCALKANGEVWTWGGNYSGELGINEVSSGKSSPVLVAGNHSFIEVRGGYKGSYALKANGEMWAWGSRFGGGIGNNTDGYAFESSPVLVVGNHSFATMSFLSGETDPIIFEWRTAATEGDIAAASWGAVPSNGEVSSLGFIQLKVSVNG